MGKTTKPLKMLVHKDIAESQIWDDLREKGHTVDVAYTDTAQTIVAYDAYFGPNAWWMTNELLKYAPAGVARARKVKYGNHSEPA